MNVKGLFAVAVLVAAVAVPAATAAPAPVSVFFFKGEHRVGVTRPGSATPLRSALQALVAGPTASERARGLTTEIPAGTRLRGVALEGGVAWVDLSRRFGAGGGSASMLGRLSQLVYTATAVKGVRAIRLVLDGKPAAALGGEGVMVDRPLTRRDVRP